MTGRACVIFLLTVLAAAVPAAGAAPVSSGSTQPASNQPVIISTVSSSLIDLPMADLTAPPPGADYQSFLKSLPSVVLDGTTLAIGTPGSAFVVTLRFSNLELRDGAKIVTNGAQIEIDAVGLSSEGGGIVSFTSKTAYPDAAPAGLNGRDGNSGGKVVLSFALSGSLIVNLFGQDGQIGGEGRAGQQGAGGAAGDNAADHLFDCAHGGGTGSPGSKGQTGEVGSKGGKGGDGGTLTLKGQAALQVGSITFSGDEGLGGQGGRGGQGGPGGVGGPGGRGSTYCGGGQAGPSGPPGDFGPRGPNGDNGARGTENATIG